MSPINNFPVIIMEKTVSVYKNKKNKTCIPNAAKLTFNNSKDMYPWKEILSMLTNRFSVNGIRKNKKSTYKLDKK